MVKDVQKVLKQSTENTIDIRFVVFSEVVVWYLFPTDLSGVMGMNAFTHCLALDVKVMGRSERAFEIRNMFRNVSQ